MPDTLEMSDVFAALHGKSSDSWSDRYSAVLGAIYIKSMAWFGKHFALAATLTCLMMVAAGTTLVTLPYYLVFMPLALIVWPVLTLTALWLAILIVLLVAYVVLFALNFIVQVIAAIFVGIWKALKAPFRRKATT